MKDNLYKYIDGIAGEITTMADYIHDNPECDDDLYKAQEVLTDFLKKNGFSVENGIGGMK